jgi:3-hydroxybutyrate dehydrogenase
MSEWDGKVALVTGAASGIGRAIAERLRADGLTVVGVDLRSGDGVDVEADLATRQGNLRAVEWALERHGRLDVLVPNAGIQHVSPVAEFDPDQWDRLIAVLLTSPFLLAHYAWDALARSGAGRIIAVASVHGIVASPYKSAYISAKHGLLGLIKTLALEGAEQGVTATAVCPAYVRTPLVEGQIGPQAEAHGLPEDRVLEEVILAPQAVKRLIEPAEIADAVAFLLSPAGVAITGTPLVMDQGWTAR